MKCLHFRVSCCRFLLFGLSVRLFALTVGKDLFMDRGAKKAWWNTVIIFAAMVLGGIYLIGVFWPCVVLIERIE